MTTNPIKPFRRTRFTVVGVCLLVALVALTLSFVRTHSTPSKNACVPQLIQIAGAKEVWMHEHHKTTNDIPVWADLLEPNGSLRSIPKCPEGGTYIIGNLSEFPACSIAAHNELSKKR